MIVGAFERAVETPCRHVLLDLAVPLVGHELFEPLGKTSKLGSRKARDNGFKFFNAHSQEIRPVPVLGKQRLLDRLDARQVFALEWLQRSAAARKAASCSGQS